MIKKLCYLALVAAWLSPSAVMAQEGEADEASEEIEVPWETEAEITYLSRFELGGAYVSEDSFKFGEYTGLDDHTGYAVSNFDIRARDAYDSEGVTFWDVSGSNLGWDSRSAEINFGEQGLYKVRLGFDQIPKYLTETAQTPFIGAGGTTLNLPANWVAGANTGAMTNLHASLTQIDLDYDRKRGQFGFSVIPAKNWEFKADFQREYKKGEKITSGLTNRNPALIPEPMDYVTDQLDAMVEYADEDVQVQLAYFMSLFSNSDKSLTWQVPFASRYPLYGSLGLPPSNQFHQLRLSGGYNVPEEIMPATRVTIDAAFGRMTQDDSYLPYTVNPTLAVTTPLPRSSFDGEIYTTLVNVGLMTRPLSRLSLRLNYLYDDRDNDSPEDEYIRVVSDYSDQQAPGGSRAVTNHTYSFRKHQAKLDADYDIFTRSRLSFGYQYERINRNHVAVNATNEHTFSGKFKTRPYDFATLKLGYAHSLRVGSAYNGADPYQSSHNPAYLAGVAPGLQWENHPSLRQFYLADRERDRYKAALMLTPRQDVTVGLRVDVVKDNYKGSLFGLQDQTTKSFAADITYMPREDLSLYLFYNVQNIVQEQDGREFRQNYAGQLETDPTRDWDIELNDWVDTIGGGFNWAAIKNRLDISADYTYSRSKGNTEPSTAGLAFSAIPDLKTIFHHVGVNAKYHIEKNLAVKLGYQFERYDVDDWGLDNVGPDSISSVVTFGMTSPNYTVHVIGASVVWQFNVEEVGF